MNMVDIIQTSLWSVNDIYLKTSEAYQMVYSRMYIHLFKYSHSKVSFHQGLKSVAPYHFASLEYPISSKFQCLVIYFFTASYTKYIIQNANVCKSLLAEIKTDLFSFKQTLTPCLEFRVLSMSTHCVYRKAIQRNDRG